MVAPTADTMGNYLVRLAWQIRFDGTLEKFRFDELDSLCGNLDDCRQEWKINGEQNSVLLIAENFFSNNIQEEHATIICSSFFY